MDKPVLTSLHGEVAKVVLDAYRSWMNEDSEDYTNFYNGGDGFRVLLTVYFAYGSPFTQLLPNVQTLKNDIIRELRLRLGMMAMFSEPRNNWRSTEVKNTLEHFSLGRIP